MSVAPSGSGKASEMGGKLASSVENFNLGFYSTPYAR